ncbi:MAG: hypothetical protein ING44_01975 [Telmatospirillum sp.]|nr:hypothetical protein [Telmatospirillum sp.]
MIDDGRLETDGFGEREGRIARCRGFGAKAMAFKPFGEGCGKRIIGQDQDAWTAHEEPILARPTRKMKSATK